MQTYLDMMADILEKGDLRQDRTGTGTYSVFGRQMRFDLAAGFPLLTTKKMHLKSIIHELLWFLQGDTNVSYLQQNGVRIWNEWADEEGNLGPVYGHQWRRWDTAQGPVDQLSELVKNLRENPYSRRHIVSAWNVGDIPKMALPPCHLLFQFHVSRGRLSCQLYTRSQDFFLGTPFNIASYALLTMMVAQQVDLEPGEFVWTGGDVHLYTNHLEQAKLQLSREPLPLPSMTILRKPDDLFSYRYEDFELRDYQSHGTIAAPISV